jgi:hypothetical protein
MAICRRIQFDYLMSHLLENPQSMRAGYNQLRIDERTRKALVLVALGLSARRSGFLQSTKPRSR